MKKRKINRKEEEEKELKNRPPIIKTNKGKYEIYEKVIELHWLFLNFYMGCK